MRNIYLFKNRKDGKNYLQKSFFMNHVYTEKFVEYKVSHGYRSLIIYGPGHHKDGAFVTLMKTLTFKRENAGKLS